MFNEDYVNDFVFQTDELLKSSNEWLDTAVFKKVPHRQWVFSIPKRLRIYFMFDRRLLAKLSQCARKVLSLYLTAGCACRECFSRGMRKKDTLDDTVPHLIDTDTDSKEFKQKLKVPDSEGL